MASSKVMASTNSTNSDLNRRHQPSTKPSQMISDYPTSANCQPTSSMMVDGLLRNVYGDDPTENTLLDAEIALIDAAGAISAVGSEANGGAEPSIRGHSTVRKTAEDVWREIVAGRSSSNSSERRECKVEAPDEIMTLEDFLAKAGAVEEVEDVKGLGSGSITERLSGGMYGFDPVVQSAYAGQQALGMVADGVQVVGFGNGGVEVMGGGAGVGRGKRRGGPLMEPLDKAAQQRQRRMIKNRESAARSRERKQAYQVELESLAVKLEEENEQLLREKEERMKERYKQLMEKVIPVVERKRPTCILRRVHSTQW